MQKSDLWKIFSDKNPSFNGEGNVTMSAAGLRKLFDQTYEHGYEQGKANADALREMAKKHMPTNPLEAFLGGLRK